MHYKTNVIRVTYLSPTDKQGPRVKATHIETGKSITLPYDFDKGIIDRAFAAARSLADKMGLVGPLLRMLFHEADAYFGKANSANAIYFRMYEEVIDN